MRNTLQNMYNKGSGEHIIITTGLFVCLFVEGVIKGSVALSLLPYKQEN